MTTNIRDCGELSTNNKKQTVTHFSGFKCNYLLWFWFVWFFFTLKTSNFLIYAVTNDVNGITEIKFIKFIPLSQFT